MKKIITIIFLLVSFLGYTQIDRVQGTIYKEVTETERNSISLGANDKMIVNNITANKLQYWDGTAWQDFGSSTGGGTNGIDGKSAYQLAVDEGYTGTLAQWLTSLEGADGAQGPAGNDGADGAGVTVDNVMTDGSTNPVENNAIFDALALKEDALPATAGNGTILINGFNNAKYFDFFPHISPRWRTSIQTGSFVASKNFDNYIIDLNQASGSVQITLPSGGVNSAIAGNKWTFSFIGEGSVSFSAPQTEGINGLNASYPFNALNATSGINGSMIQFLFDGTTYRVVADTRRYIGIQNGAQVPLTGYAIATTSQAVAPTDFANGAIGKLEYKIDNLSIGSSTDDQTASEVAITDAGDLYAVDNVEWALQALPTFHDQAGEITFSPNGSISSTTVQAAIQEVRDEAGGGSSVTVIDDDSFATATSTNVPSAESVKAYVDANSGGSSIADTDALTEGATNLYYTEARVSANAQVTANTGKVGITTQQANDITANNVKISNATHTGEVTGDVVLTISNNAVTTAKIASNAVTGAKIDDEAIDQTKLAANAVVTAKILDGAVTDGKLGTSINANKIGGGNVSTTEYDRLNGVTSNIQNQINSLEDSLGNPASDGQILSSTSAGVRSWIDAPSGSSTTLNNTTTSTATDEAATANVAKVLQDQIDALELLPISVENTTKTFALADADSFFNTNGASDIVFTVPTDASVNFPINTVLSGVQKGDGLVAIAYSGGVTGETVATYGKGDRWAIAKTAANTWIVITRPANRLVTNATYVGLSTDEKNNGTIYLFSETNGQ